MKPLSAILDHIDGEVDRSVDRLFKLVRIPSISTDPQYRAECRKAGQYLVDELDRMGFAASLRDTPGHPMVVAHYAPPAAGPKSPHALFYGHYDVQPADPVDRWTSPPFEPQRRRDRDGVERLYGRGTADDKGQLMTFIEAFRAWLATGNSLPSRITVLIEGEEESGSPSLEPFLRSNRAELRCDAAFVCDTDMWDKRTPAITTRLRGIVHEEVTVTGPRIDLHSGLFGGAAMNPIRVLSRVLSSLHDRNGKVAVPGFYDGVSELPAATKRQWRSLKFSEKRFLGGVGLRIPAGERGRMVLEQIWSRPTLEFNGILGGYTGKGTKTVLPSQASAKISFRLVGEQDPNAVRAAFRTHVRALIPGDCKVTFAGRAASPAIVVAEDSPMLAMAAAALQEEFGRETILKGSGGSIPVVSSFKRILGMDSVLVGFGLDDDAIHSPNEKYDLSSYHRGIRSWARVLAKLGQQPRQ
ncbi:MAG: M20/M25/M40 family metallo-hydrolase [Pseudomonadota bacterium]|nr:M20/M25/M40 family metallo-hydrolase [Pseudomonadota bacterium]